MFGVTTCVLGAPKASYACSILIDRRTALVVALRNLSGIYVHRIQNHLVLGCAARLSVIDGRF